MFPVNLFLFPGSQILFQETQIVFPVSSQKKMLKIAHVQQIQRPNVNVKHFGIMLVYLHDSHRFIRYSMMLFLSRWSMTPWTPWLADQILSCNATTIYNLHISSHICPLIQSFNTTLRFIQIYVLVLLHISVAPNFGMEEAKSRSNGS